MTFVKNATLALFFFPVKHNELAFEETALYRVLSANGILDDDAPERYWRYDPANPGCSLQHPVVIDETEDYVHLEYEVLPFIVGAFPYPFVDYRVQQQALVFEGDRALDILTVELTEPRLPSPDGAGSDSEPRVLGTKDYYFDITSGYNAISRRISLKQLDRPGSAARDEGIPW